MVILVRIFLYCDSSQDIRFSERLNFSQLKNSCDQDIWDCSKLNLFCFLIQIVNHLIQPRQVSLFFCSPKIDGEVGAQDVKQERLAMPRYSQWNVFLDHYSIFNYEL
jgi:hypothetical protein